MQKHTAATLTRTMGSAIVCIGVVMALLSACRDSVTPASPPPQLFSVSGTVSDSATGAPIAGAAVMLRTYAGEVIRSTTTGADGHFELKDVWSGVFTLSSIAVGYAPMSAPVTVNGDSATQNLRLAARPGLVEVGDFAMYVPSTPIDFAFGFVLALGDRDTRAFATGGAFGDPDPAVEASLEAMGRSLRNLAASYGLGIIGTSWTGMPNNPKSDTLIFKILDSLSSASHHPIGPDAPLILYGTSNGAPEAAGFAARNPQWAGALVLQVPAAIETLTDSDALTVPSYLVLAEHDTVVNNAALVAAFEANRKAGGIWALAVQRGAGHDSFTDELRLSISDWIAWMAVHCLPATGNEWSGDPHVCSANGGAAGWLGDRTTGIAWPWASYPGDRSSASWLPDAGTAHDWERLVAAKP